MFFVGATGQLLTLILTVSIPFMMLISGHQKINFNQNFVPLEVEQSSDIDVNIDYQTDSYNFVASPENLKYSSYYYMEKFLYLPPDKFRVNWKKIYLENIGNKAPPLSSTNYSIYLS